MPNEAKVIRTLSEVFMPGIILISQGEPSFNFYLLQEGSVDIVVDGRKVNTVTAEKGGAEFIGEIGAILGKFRTATVVTATQCTALKLDARQLEVMIEKCPALGVRLAKSLALKLYNTNSKPTVNP